MRTAFTMGGVTVWILPSPKKSHSRHGLHEEVRGRPWVLVFTFCLGGSRISPCSLMRHWIADLRISRHSPVSISHFSTGDLVLQICPTVPGFTWALEIWTQVVTLVWQVFYPLKHLSSFHYFTFFWFIFCLILSTTNILELYLIVCDYFPAPRI